MKLLALLHEVSRLANEDHRVVEADIIVEHETRDGRALDRQFHIQSISFDRERNVVSVKIVPGAAK